MNKTSTQQNVAGRFWAADSQPGRGLTQVRWDTILAAPLDRVFAFFSDAANLERLTPPWVRFRISSPMPVVMREGLEIDYRISVRGLPVPWRSRIDVWEPGGRFVDRQVIGPYRWWRHEHRFEASGSATRVIDEIAFVPRFRWVSGRLVRRDVERIFAYRQQALAREFASGGAA